MSILVTEKAASAVRQIIRDEQQRCLTPDLLEIYKKFEAENGRAPRLNELAERVGKTPEELAQQLGQTATALFGKVHLRVRVVGGGCSGFQNKLDLDPEVNEKMDEVFEFHGVPVAVDRRSLMYLTDATVDYHNDLTRSGFSITNPNAKSTCGCGSSYSM
jgi:iron-sulfur cluster assembly protein